MGEVSENLNVFPAPEGEEYTILLHFIFHYRQPGFEGFQEVKKRRQIK